MKTRLTWKWPKAPSADRPGRGRPQPWELQAPAPCSSASLDCSLVQPRVKGWRWGVTIAVPGCAHLTRAVGLLPAWTLDTGAGWGGAGRGACPPRKAAQREDRKQQGPWGCPRAQGELGEDRPAAQRPAGRGAAHLLLPRLAAGVNSGSCPQRGQDLGCLQGRPGCQLPSSRCPGGGGGQDGPGAPQPEVFSLDPRPVP